MRLVIALLAVLSIPVLHAQTPSWQWVHGIGGEHQDDAKSVAIAPDGSVYELGFFQSTTITLGDTTLTNPIDPDHNLFLAKYTPDGELLWAMRPSGMHYGCIPEAMTVDQEGNVIIAGSFRGYNIRFGDLLIQGGDVVTDAELLVVKLDADGNGIWAYSQGGTQAANAEYIMDVRTDGQGNIFALGTTHSGSINLGGTVYENDALNMLFLLKFNPNGELLNVVTSQSESTHFSYSMGIDEFDHVYIGGGLCNNEFGFGPVQVTSSGTTNNNGFLFKFDNQLQPVWGRIIGGSSYEEVFGIALDGNGHLYAAGISSSNTIITEGLSIPNPYEDGGMVAQFDLDGEPQWIRAIGDSIAPWDVEADADHVYVMANRTAQLPVVIGSDTVQGHGEYQICLFALDADGTPQWAEGIHGSRTFSGDLAVASPTDLFVTGVYAYGEAYFGQEALPMEAQGAIYFTDVFLARLHVEEMSLDISSLAGSELSIFPVPATDRLEVRSAGGPLLDVVLIDAMGRIVLQAPANGQATLELMVSGLPAGNYLLRSRTNASVQHATVTLVR